MKKVNLLSKAEMKKVMGGNAPIEAGNTCAWHDGEDAVCNLNKADAQAMQAHAGGKWCCDSCPSNLC